MRKIIPSLGALWLIGCSYFSPDYHKPDTNVPAKWSAQNSNVESISESLPYLAWWQKFNDPVLNQYIESGLNNNLTIEAAKANLEAAQGQLTTVKLNWLPTMNIIGGAIGGNSQNSLTPIGNLGVVGNSGAFFALIPQYTLNVFTNYTLQKQAGYNVEAAKNAVLSVRLAVIGQVSNAYFVYLAQLQILDQFKQLNQNLNELITITRAMNQRGMGNDIVLDELLSKQQLVAGQIELVQKNLIAAQNALRYLINQNPGAIISNADFGKFNTQFPEIGNQPATVLANRPDVLLAETQFKLATQNVGVAASQLLPNVQLDYFGGQSDVGVNGTNGIYTPTTDAYLNWSINPAVFGKISSMTGTKKIAYANYIDTVRKALHDVDNDLLNHRDANQRYLLIYQAYQAASDKYQLNAALYKRGIISYNDTLNDKLNVDQAAIALNQIKLAQMTTLVNLYQDLGGGYNYNKAPIK